VVLFRINNILPCLAASVVLLANGCAHSRKDAEVDLVSTGVARPPVFLVGPAALLLTNAAGYIAAIHVQGDSVMGKPEVTTGELLARGSKLFFVPDASTHQRAGRGGGLSFIWDAAERKGYVLDEPMQAYAPISSSVQFTNLAVLSSESLATVKLAGSLCRRATATASAADGSTTSFQICQSAETGLALQITSTQPRFDLQFSKLELRAPANDVFAPPAGFTRYDSLEAMMNELASRQHDIRRAGHGIIPRDFEPPPAQPPTPGGPAR